MSDQSEIAVEREPVIDGLTRSQWMQILKTMTADPGWQAVMSIIGRDVDAENQVIFNSPEPERQLAHHEAIGFVKFANRLTEIAGRARYIVERGVSPDASSRDLPL